MKNSDIPIPNFDPFNHYYSVPEQPNKVFSTKTGDFVNVNNPTYLDWLAVTGNETTNLPSIDDLAFKLIATGPVRPVDAAVLVAYQGLWMDRLMPEPMLKLVLDMEQRLRTLEGTQHIPPGQIKSSLRGKL